LDATGSPRQRNWKFESIFLQQRVHERSVPDRDIGLEGRRPIARDLSHSASVTTREAGAFPRPSKAVLETGGFFRRVVVDVRFCDASSRARSRRSGAALRRRDDGAYWRAAGLLPAAAAMSIWSLAAQTGDARENQAGRVTSVLPTHTADFGPDLEFPGPGSSVLGGSDMIAAEMEEAWAERNRCAWPADLNCFICRSRRRVG
jgi:hypothetical protein